MSIAALAPAANRPDIAQTAEAFALAVGPGNVTADPECLHAAETATFATSQHIPLIVRPATTAEVVRCVDVASRHGIALYTVSGGKNWGYGSRVPVRTDCALLDLGRMNRIVALDENLAYATIEPGVTQKQLHDHVRQHCGDRLWIDATGSSPHSSVIGNALERGHGLTPYCDHVSQICALEVVLATGQLIRTGFAAYPGALNGPLDRFGPGPQVDGLFSQSNLGIVTEATIWLLPAPEHVELAFLGMDSDEMLVAVIDALRPMRLQGSLRSGPHVGNDSFVLARNAQMPAELRGMTSAAAAARLRDLAAGLGLRRWNGTVPLYGLREEVAAIRRRLLSVLPPGVTCSFADADTLAEGGTNGARHGDLLNVFRHFSGGLGAYGLRRAYWRSGTPPPSDIATADLDADRCGVAAIAISSPFDGARVAELSTMIAAEILHHGFEPAVSFWGMRPRTLQLHAFICFDRDHPEEEARADACRRAVQAKAIALGYYPHRLDIAAMAIADLAEPGAAWLNQTLKAALDPQGILSPGRYIAHRPDRI